MSKITGQGRLSLINNTFLSYPYFSYLQFLCFRFLFFFLLMSISLIRLDLTIHTLLCLLHDTRFIKYLGKYTLFCLFCVCVHERIWIWVKILWKRQYSLWYKHMHAIHKYTCTHLHAQLLSNSWGLGRCVTHVRPLLTPCFPTGSVCVVSKGNVQRGWGRLM